MKLFKMKFVLLLCLTLMMSGVLFAANPKISDLSYRMEGDVILVSFKLINAFPPEIEKRMKSGLKVSFRHFIEVIDPKWYWWDKEYFKCEIVTTVKYDNLTKQYSLTKSVDGGLIESETTNGLNDVAVWMTEFSNVSGGSVNNLKVGNKYVVRVKTELLNRNVLFFIPWDMDTNWKKIPLLLKSDE